MRVSAELKVQLVLALVGVPAIFYFWKGDAKWPNPLIRAKPKE
jgi:hypothetical protein